MSQQCPRQLRMEGSGEGPCSSQSLQLIHVVLLSIYPRKTRPGTSTPHTLLRSYTTAWILFILRLLHSFFSLKSGPFI